MRVLEDVKMRYSRPLVAALLLGLSASMAIADTAAALKALDPDNDGTIDLAEAQAGATKVFGTLIPTKTARSTPKSYPVVSTKLRSRPRIPMPMPRSIRRSMQP